MTGNQNIYSTKCKIRDIFFFFREIIILENPLCEFNNELIVDEIFRKVCAKLVEMGKTVIVASRYDNVIWMLLVEEHNISFYFSFRFCDIVTAFRY